MLHNQELLAHVDIGFQALFISENGQRLLNLSDLLIFEADIAASLLSASPFNPEKAVGCGRLRWAFTALKAFKLPKRPLKDRFSSPCKKEMRTSFPSFVKRKFLKRGLNYDVANFHIAHTLFFGGRSA